MAPIQIHIRTLLLAAVLACFGAAAAGGARTAEAATLSFSASQGYAVGQTFPVYVKLSAGPGEAINAVSANISYAPSQVRLVSISKTDSVMSIWVTEPSFSNNTGTADLEAVVVNPGFSGTNGTVATLNFQVVSAGVTTLTFAQSAALQNDGQGTNVLASAPSKSISLGTGAPDSATTDALPPGAPGAPVISSATNPDPAKWYNDPDPSFSWKVPAGVTAVRISYDRAPISTPTVVYAPAISSKGLSGLADGTYYFHAQFKAADGWGAIAHFRFNIDATPPAAFKVSEAHPDDSTDARPILFFNTTDAGSGMDHYDVKVGDDHFQTVSAESVASNPYSPSIQTPGSKTVVVNAYDKAGNVTTGSAQLDIQPIDAPAIDSFAAEITEGDILKVLGHSYPDSTVTIFLKYPNGEETSDIARTSLAGNFTMIWPKALEPGVYTFTAMVEDGKGAQSYRGEPHTVVVGEKAIYRIGSVVINYLSIIVLCIIAGAFLIGCLIYAFHWLSRLRSRLRRSLSSAEHTVHEDFDELRDDMARHLAMLETAMAGRKLSKEEQAIIASFKKRLNASERDIISKIGRLKKDVD